MKPLIRKKDKDTDGNQRYILQWEEDGKICTKTLNAQYLLDSIKKSRSSKEETD
jgi:hypothetical protein